MVIPLLQSIYDHQVTLPYKDEFYKQALSDIELFSLSSQAYHLLRESGRIDQVPEFFQASLKATYTRGINQNLFMKHKEAEVLRLFERNQMDAIPLKGVHFAERYFGHFAARVTSDIDVFVQSARLQESIQHLETIGYTFEIIKDHHARMHKDGLMVELHWTLDKQHWSNLSTAPFWQKAERLEPFTHIKQLSPLHTFYFICLHGARHQMDSIRYIIDVVQMLHTYGDQIDYFLLMDQAVSDKTSKRIQAVLSIVYSQFPHLHERKPLPFQVIDCHWNYSIIRSAKLGIRTKEYYLYKLFFKHLIFDTWKHKVNSLRRAY